MRRSSRSPLRPDRRTDDAERKSIWRRSTVRPTLFSMSRSTRDISFRLWEDKRYISRTAAAEPHLPVATVSPFSHRVEQIQVSQLTEATLSGTKFNAWNWSRYWTPT